MEKWIKYPDCVRCKGKGWHIGGDEQQQCPACGLRKLSAREIEISRLIPNEYGPTWDDVLAHMDNGCCGPFFDEANADIDAALRSGSEIVEPIEVISTEYEDVFMVVDGHHRAALSYRYGRTAIPFVNVDEVYDDEDWRLDRTPTGGI